MMQSHGLSENAVSKVRLDALREKRRVQRSQSASYAHLTIMKNTESVSGHRRTMNDLASAPECRLAHT